jgi:hypothetical protein
MRWPRRSARERLLKDIHLGRRGQSTTGSEQGSSARSTGIKGLFMVIFIVFLVLGFFVGVGYFGSDAGQRSFTDISSRAKEIVLDPILDIFSGAQSFGANDFFATNTDPQSKVKGLTLRSFSPLSYVIPAGQPIDIEYVIDFENVNEQTIDTTFFCELKAQQGELDYQITGSITPATIVSLQKGTPVRCTIDGAETGELDGAYIVKGSFQYPFVTKDATLPVYIIPGQVNNELKDTNFFEAYGLDDVTQSQLRVTSKGEPVTIAIGTGAAGDTTQPVVARDDVQNAYNVVGITLTNKAGGQLVSIDNMELRLPQGVTIPTEELERRIESCPFENSGTYRNQNVYTLAPDAKDDLFDFYFSENSLLEPSDFFGKENRKTYQCLIEIDQNIFAGAPYVKTEYVASVEYVYKVKSKTEAITIKAPESSFVSEEILG